MDKKTRMDTLTDVMFDVWTDCQTPSNYRFQDWIADDGWIKQS